MSQSLFTCVLLAVTFTSSIYAAHPEFEDECKGLCTPAIAVGSNKYDLT